MLALIWPNVFYTSPFTIEGNFYFSENNISQTLFKKNNSMSLEYVNNGGDLSSNRIKLNMYNTSNALSSYEALFLPTTKQANQFIRC